MPFGITDEPCCITCIEVSYMQVKEIHPRLSAEERDRAISHITDELLRIAAAVRGKMGKP